MGRFTDRIFRAFGLCRQPVVKAYDGYGDADDVIVHGHVLRLSPLPRKKYRQDPWLNFFGLIRLFMVKPIAAARVMISWNGETRETRTDLQGFFRLAWKPLNPFTPGWHEAKVTYVSDGAVPVQLAAGTCQVFIPHSYQYSFISDIDDTFLVSHSSHLWRRLKVLMLRNARSRQAFEGVAEHYRLLAGASRLSEEDNPFFYVSSSEWNLYDYIREFCRKESLPRGVFLLNTMKQLHELLKTGQDKHVTKFFRIARILKSYPRERYILLGDNSQEDPSIYARVVKEFRGMIHAVYIRNINASKAARAQVYCNQIAAAGVACCFFNHSSEAIAHSVAIGLIEKHSAQ